MPAILHLQSCHNYSEKGRQHETSGQERKLDTENVGDGKEIAFDSVGKKRAYLR